MSDPSGLHVYGGDPVIVAERNELLRIAVSLRSASSTLSQTAVISWQDFGVDPALWPAAIGSRVFLAARLPSVLDRLDQLASACDLAAEAYFSVEAQVARNFFDLGVEPLQQLGALANSPAGAAVRPLSAAVGGAAASLGIAGLLLMPSGQGTQFVRAAAGVAPAVAGATTVPGLLEGLRQNLEVLGVETTDAATAALISSGTVSPARSLEQHAARLHQSYAPGGSIRIEVYPLAAANSRQLVVYLPGTQSAALSGSMPLDMGSNLNAMARPGLAASERAVGHALQQLGVTKNDRVLFVGHSQGALIANNLTASGSYHVSGFISMGGPLAHRPPASAPTIALEHTNDPVPALAGRTNPLTENLATVQRELPADTLTEAHAMSGYRQTAALADESTNPGLVRVRGELAGQLEGLGGGIEYRFELKRE